MKNMIKILMEIFVVLVSLTLLVMSVVLFEFLPIDGSVALVALSSITVVLALIIVTVFDYSTGKYECKKCGHKFKPTFSAYIWGIHTPTRRYLKCPDCGEKSFCKMHMEQE